jgi:anti-sigma regulatory factor (Ser/Thr protein kinase)
MTKLKMHIKIRAEISEAEAFCRLLRQELKALPSQADRFALEILCREAIANAIEHGCRFDPSKKVGIDLEIRNGSLLCRVYDEGEGFFLDATAQPGNDNLMERNHGMKLLEKYSDRYYYEDGGRVLVFEKRIREGGPA